MAPNHIGYNLRCITFTAKRILHLIYSPVYKITLRTTCNSYWFLLIIQYFSIMFFIYLKCMWVISFFIYLLTLIKLRIGNHWKSFLYPIKWLNCYKRKSFQAFFIRVLVVVLLSYRIFGLSATVTWTLK